jgi:hypothetical protein
MTTDAPPTVVADVPTVDVPPKKAAAPGPRLPKPDADAHKAALAALEATIAAKKERVAEIKALLDARAEDRKTGGSPEVAAARAKLGELRDSFKAELVSRGWGANGARKSVCARAPTAVPQREPIYWERRRERKGKHAPASPHTPSLAPGVGLACYCWCLW